MQRPLEDDVIAFDIAGWDIHTYTFVCINVEEVTKDAIR